MGRGDGDEGNPGVAPRRRESVGQDNNLTSAHFKEESAIDIKDFSPTGSPPITTAREPEKKAEPTEKGPNPTCIYCNERKSINGRDRLCRACRDDLELVTFCPTCGGEKTGAYRQCINCRYDIEKDLYPKSMAEREKYAGRKKGPGPDSIDRTLEAIFIEIEREAEDLYIDDLIRSERFKQKLREQEQDGSFVGNWDSGLSPRLYISYDVVAPIGTTTFIEDRQEADAAIDKEIRARRISALLQVYPKINAQVQSGGMSIEEAVREIYQQMFA